MELTTYNRRETVVIGAQEQPGDGTRYTFLIVLYGVEGDIPKKDAKAMGKVLAGRDVPPFPAKSVSIFPKDDGATLKGSIQDTPYEELAQMAQAKVSRGDGLVEFGRGNVRWDALVASERGWAGLSEKEENPWTVASALRCAMQAVGIRCRMPVM